MKINVERVEIPPPTKITIELNAFEATLLGLLSYLGEDGDREGRRGGSLHAALPQELREVVARVLTSHGRTTHNAGSTIKRLLEEANIV